MTKLGLALNEAKTSVRDARQERFDFLGYTFGPHHYRKDGHWYLGASPSRKSVQRFKDKIGGTLVPGNKGAWSEVRDQLNRMLRGWSGYFGYGTRLQAHRAIDAHVYDRVRNFLVKRHKVQGRGNRHFPHDLVFGESRRARLEARAPWTTPWALRRSQSESRMPEIGPSGSMSGEGKRSVGQQTTPPRLSSTLPG